MSAGGGKATEGAPQLSTRQLVATVAMTLGVQSLASMAMAVPAVLAPVAAADFGFAPTAVGVLVSATYVTAMLTGLAGGMLIARFGPIRLFQFVALVIVSGLALGATAQLALVFAAMVLIGGANGVVNPSTSHILARAAPPGVRVMVFSIKQTGVPLGAALSGVTLPALLLFINWHAALLVVASAFFVLIACLQPFRRLYDGGRMPQAPLQLSSILSPLAEVWGDRRMRELAVASTVYAAVQLCLMTYLVSYLKLEMGYTLVLAGLIFSVASMAGVFARVVWGLVADRLFKPRHVLAGLGIGMSFFGFVVAGFGPQWPVAWVVVVSALFAATAAAWNGVYLAEVARMAPPGRVASITGGTQVFTFTGSMFGPPAFGVVVSLTGSYAHGYILFAILPLLMGLQLLRPAPVAR